MTTREIRRALLSVSDKTGVAWLGAGLASAGVEIVSTGSTAAHLRAAGVPVTLVAEVTGYPEVLDGRVKTLHPAVHAGLLADRTRADHVETLTRLGIAAFDLLVVNLYPFRETVAGGAATEEVVEQIDVGGPAMVRAAAKNHRCVAVVVSPDRYAQVLEAVRDGGFDLPTRRALAAEAFAHTAAYDVAIANWFAAAQDPPPPFAAIALERAQILRYGENPHQRGALYLDRDAPDGIAQAEQLHGKQMSFNNYVDADAARRAARDFAEPCVAIVKHANPCGIAVAETIALAYARAHACDPVSAYGGVVAANRAVDEEMATALARTFTEVVIAPDFREGALEILTRKASVRILRDPAPAVGDRVELRQVSGGFLWQDADAISAPGDDPATWSHRAGPPASPADFADLAFAWRAVRAVRSNAILLARGQATVGVGMGQVNRVDAARLAVSRAGERAAGSVAASDAFFPFPDGLEVLCAAGVRAVVSPGGSVRDAEVLAAADAAGVSAYFTGARHFTH